LTIRSRSFPAQVLGQFLGAPLGAHQVQVGLDRAGQPDTVHPLPEQQIPWRLGVDDHQIRALTDGAGAQLTQRSFGGRTGRQADANLRDVRQKWGVALGSRFMGDRVVDPMR
jgi:hypothetical protein